jgi:hypothetical protein
MSLEDDDDVIIEPNDVLEQDLPTSDDYEEPPPPEEDEQEAYSKRVQKRIDKLVYKEKVANQRAEELERKLAEQAERIKALAEAQQAQAEERQNRQHENELQDLRQRRRDALEIGDHDEVNAIDEKLLDIKVKSKTEPKREPNATQNTPARESQPTPPVNAAMNQWLQANAWIRDPKQEAKLDKADAIYKDLVAKGYDPEEPELYEEIDKRMKRETPPPGNGPDRGQITGSDKSAFTAQDKRDMENWGLDPNDPKARKEWIKQKAGN